MMSNMQGGSQRPELRLRSTQQDGSTPTSNTSQTPTTSQTSSTTVVAQNPPSSLTAGAAIQGPQDPNVQIIDEGDVEGTICDCGEITLPAGGWPKWPLLAAIPLVCVTGICSPDNPPQCIPGRDAECTETQIPEPATLLLLSSGLAALGAGARRRRFGQKAEVKQAVPTSEV
jgi:hypothetical protein